MNTRSFKPRVGELVVGRVLSEVRAPLSRLMIALSYSVILGFTFYSLKGVATERGFESIPGWMLVRFLCLHVAFAFFVVSLGLLAHLAASSWACMRHRSSGLSVVLGTDAVFYQAESRSATSIPYGNARIHQRKELLVISTRWFGWKSIVVPRRVFQPEAQRQEFIQQLETRLASA